MYGMMTQTEYILMMMMQIVPNILLPLIIGTILLSVRERKKPEKPCEQWPDRHIYYPYKKSILLKVLQCLTILCIFFMAIPMLGWVRFCLADEGTFKAIAVFSILIGAFLLLGTVAKSRQSKVEYVMVDLKGLTIHQRFGPPEFHAYQDYREQLVDGVICYPLLFKNADGKEAALRLKYLCPADRDAIAGDLQKLQQTGKLPGSGMMQKNFVPNPVQGGAAPNPSRPQVFTPTRPQNIVRPVTQQGEAVRTDHMAANAKMDQRAEKRAEYYADPANYARHLQRVADKLIPKKKQEAIQYMEQGEKSRAIALVINQTGCSAQEAREIAENYKKYLLGMQDAKPEQEQVRSQEELDAIYADPAKYAAYLKEEAAKLSAQQQRTLLELIEKGDTVNAIKKCREMTHLGLKDAKEIVERHQDTLTAVKAAQQASMASVQASVTGVHPQSGIGNTEQQISTPQVSWTLRVTDNEQAVTEERRLESELDRALTEVSMGREEFLVLAPSVTVSGVEFLQIARDANGIFLHMEAGLPEKDAQGHTRIVCKDRMMSRDALELCLAYFRGEKVSLDGWYELQMT